MNEEYKISRKIGLFDADAFDPDQFQLPESTDVADEGHPLD